MVVTVKELKTGRNFKRVGVVELNQDEYMICFKYNNGTRESVSKMFVEIVAVDTELEMFNIVDIMKKENVGKQYIDNNKGWIWKVCCLDESDGVISLEYTGEEKLELISVAIEDMFCLDTVLKMKFKEIKEQ